MDINNDLEEPEAVVEDGLDSLESEIDALSKIIDTKDGASKLDDFKLDSDVFSDDLPFDTEASKCELVDDENLVFNDILFSEKSIPTSSGDNKFLEVKEGKQ